MRDATVGGVGDAGMERRALRRRAFWLEYTTIGWNLFEGGAALAAGILAASVALVAFGLDSTIEVFASAVVVWQLHGANEEREARALQLIGGAYLAVSVYVLQEAIRSLVAGHRADASPGGIVLLCGTVVAMLLLALGKQRTGKRLGSATVLADARFSVIDAALAGAVLVGLVLNAALGWWWADQALAILIALLAAKEGVEGLRGEAH